ncbi:uncharacterized protein LY89DRAFT_724952 [Mollisia scopiformis]|uniref:Uncharacterized protein n=1 Tax=Mollisia scopiformis TaxID=149040 RepID=A0A132B7U7_MOLSC|nr:uncharacterized protein LY89DRAFT_724952 [Mollisia scopiformis]KUJ08478.1 hypothetical protein LY89DRAFT_724952 [Mollisia scopiformis]
MDITDKKQSAMKLVFITQVASVKKSKETSTIIRKHVMRDIGKSRRKQRRYPQTSLESPESISRLGRQQLSVPRETPVLPWVESQEENGPLLAQPEPPHQHDPAKSTGAGSYPDSQHRQPPNGIFVPADVERPAIDRTWTGRSDPFVKFPVEMNDRIRELIDLAFDDRYINIGPFRDACLPVGMLDEAAFHQVLSNALLNIASRRPTGAQTETYDAMNHHALAINSINERIKDVKTATSDGFIGAVAGFMCYHAYTGNLAACQTHMKGVEELIRLRGGVETLDSNKPVRLLLGWSDVGGSAIEDSQPRFPLPQKLLPEIDSFQPCQAISNQIDDILTIWSYRFPSHVTMLILIGDLLRFNNHLKREMERTDGRILSNGDFATGYLFPLLHRTLSLAGDAIIAAPDDLNVLQACRIGCTLYLAEIRRLFGICGVITSLQTQKLQHYLRSSIANWKGLGLLKLWCLAMGGMEAVGDLKGWYAEEIKREASLMGWATPRQLEMQMEGMLWFPKAHGPAFWVLCRGQGHVAVAPGTNSLHSGKWDAKWKPALQL